MNSSIFAYPAADGNAGNTGKSGSPDAFDLLWAQLALIGVTITFCNAIVYYPLRLGLGTPVLMIPSCVLIVAAALLAPLLLPHRGAFAYLALRTVAMPMASLLVMASMVLALPFGGLLLIAYSLLFLAGSRRALQLLSTQSPLELVFCLGAGCIIGIYLFATVQGLNYAGIYSPEQSLIGTLNHDTTFHSAVAFLIQNFGIPSLGADGILPLKYHFGSHFWFAGLGRLTSSEPVFSYGAGVPIVLAPMLVTALFLSGASVDRGRKALPVYVLIGAALVLFSDVIGSDTYYISESYTCALIGLLLLLPLLARIANESLVSSRTLELTFAAAIIAIPLLAVMKISVGALWTAAVGYLALRRYGFSKKGLAVSLVACILMLAVLKALSPSTNDYQTLSKNLIIPFFYFRIAGLVGISSFVIPAIFLFSKIRLYGGAGLRRIFLAKSDLMFESTMVVMVFGAIPPMIGIPQDSAVWYFLNVAQWIAMPLFTARLVPVGVSPPARTVLMQAFPVMIIAAGLALGLTPAVFRQTISVVKDADKASSGQLLHGEGPAHYLYHTFVREHVLWGAKFRQIIAALPGAQLIKTVRSAIPVPDKYAAVFIAPENKLFWSRAQCHEAYNSPVSLTGQPSLLGRPPGCGPDAYTSDYGMQTEARSMSDPELCKHAQQRNIHRVLIVAESEPGGHNRMLDCAGPGTN